DAGGLWGTRGRAWGTRAANGARGGGRAEQQHAAQDVVYEQAGAGGGVQGGSESRAAVLLNESVWVRVEETQAGGQHGARRGASPRAADGPPVIVGVPPSVAQSPPTGFASDAELATRDLLPLRCWVEADADARRCAAETGGTGLHWSPHLGPIPRLLGPRPHAAGSVAASRSRRGLAAHLPQPSAISHQPSASASLARPAARAWGALLRRAFWGCVSDLIATFTTAQQVRAAWLPQRVSLGGGCGCDGPWRAAIRLYRDILGRGTQAGGRPSTHAWSDRAGLARPSHHDAGLGRPSSRPWTHAESQQAGADAVRRESDRQYVLSHPSSGCMMGRNTPADFQAIERPFTIAARERATVPLESASPLPLVPPSSAPLRRVLGVGAGKCARLPCPVPVACTTPPNISFTPPSQHLEHYYCASPAANHGDRRWNCSACRMLGPPSSGHWAKDDLAAYPIPLIQGKYACESPVPSSAARALRDLRLALLFAPPSNLIDAARSSSNLSVG
ncbi:hypothetical protein PSPO01_01664, partial [Paraphaeosphaeria sporulosa]